MYVWGVEETTCRQHIARMERVSHDPSHQQTPHIEVSGPSNLE
jgi:hypothetical protein